MVDLAAKDDSGWQNIPDWANPSTPSSSGDGGGAPEPRSAGWGDIPDWANPESGGASQSAAQAPSDLEDISKAAGAGLISGAAGLVDLPAALTNIAGRGVGKAAEWSGRVDPGTIENLESYLPTGQWAQNKAAQLTGGFSQYQPQTTAGKYAKSISEFVPATVAAALSGGTSLAPALLTGAVAPGIASEAVGDVAKTYMPSLEPYARLGAAVASGHLSSGLLSSGRAATTASALSQDADNAIQSATRQAAGAQPTLTAKDIPSSLAPVVSDVLDAKGNTPAAAREGIIRAATGMQDVPSILATGAPIPRGMQQSVQNAVMNGKQAIADRLSQMAPDVANPGAELSSPVFEAYKNASDQVNNAYASARSIPAEFSNPADKGASLQASINSQLNQAGLRPQYLIGNKSYPQANDAIKNLVKVAGSRSMTMNEVGSERQAMNELFASASGADRVALRSVIDGYDNYFQTLAQNGAGTGNLLDAFNQYKNANDLSRNFHSVFDVSQNVAPGVSGISQGFRDIYKSGNFGTDTLMPANNSLAKNILDPAKGSATYNQLLAAIKKYAPDQVDDFNDAVKANILAPNAAANKFGFALKPAQMSGVINGVGQKVMSPDEISNLKFHLAAQNLLDQRLVSEPMGELLRSAITGAMTKFATRAGAGAVGYYFGEIPGAVALEMARMGLSKIPETFKEASQRASAFSGAPTKLTPRLVAQKAFKQAAPYAAASVASAPPLTIHRSQQNHAAGGRTERASGGRIMDHDAEANRLVRAADIAKNSVNKTTEKLLDVPDEAIIKALDVAQQAI